MLDEMYTQKQFLAELFDKFGMQHTAYQFALNQEKIVEVSGKENQQFRQVIANNQSAFETTKNMLLDDVGRLSMVLAELADHCKEHTSDDLKAKVAEALLKVARE